MRIVKPKNVQVTLEEVSLEQLTLVEKLLGRMSRADYKEHGSLNSLQAEEIFKFYDELSNELNK